MQNQVPEYIPVELIGSHRHAGERGRVAIHNGQIVTEAPDGIGRPDRIRVELENCQHGMDACWALRTDMVLLG